MYNLSCKIYVVKSYFPKFFVEPKCGFSGRPRLLADREVVRVDTI
jgi:hypothetical protein